MDNSPVKLGLMPPLSGVVAIYGPEISRAGQIACREVNDDGGVLGRPLELVIADDGSLPESAVAAARRLVREDGCSAIIGNLLSNSRIAVAYQVAEPSRIPYLNFSFYEGSILSRYFFHFAALPNQQIDLMIPYMLGKFGRRMFFAGNNYEWPRGSIAAAKLALAEAGGEVVGEEYLPIDAPPQALEALLDQVQAAAPDVFVPYFAGTDQLHLLSRFSERGLKRGMAVVMGHYDEAMTSRLPPAVRADCYSCNTYFMGVATPENRHYLASLAAWPGVAGIWPAGDGILTNFGEGAYLCVKAFAKAANQIGSLDPEALVEALADIEVTGPQGTVRMDPVTHHARVNCYLSRCREDGTFEIVESFGAIEPVLPERYRHLRLATRSTLEDEIRLQSRMLEQMSEAVLLISARDARIIYANPGAERMYGYAADELIGRPEALLHAPPGTETAAEVARMLDTLNRKGCWQGELRSIRKDGTIFWCSSSASIFTHPVHGEVCMSVRNDITERRREERAIQAERQRFINILDTMPLYLVLLSPDYHVPFANRFFRERFGDAQGRRCFEYLFGRAEPCEVCETFKALKSGQPLQWEWHGPDGRDYHIHDFPFTDVDGSQLILEAGIDITERKQSEERVRESERKFRSMTDTSPLAIYMSSGLEQQGEYLNPTFTELFGYTLAEAPSAAHWWPLAYPDETYRQRIVEEWQDKVARAITTHSAIEPMEVVVTCKDGTRKNILWGFVSTGIQNWAFGLDLTARKSAEEALRKTQNLLNETQQITKVGGWEYDVPSGRVTWTDEVYRIHGLTPEYDPSDPQEDMRFYSPEDRIRISEVFRQAVAEGIPYDIEAQLLNAQGERLWVRTSGHAVRKNGVTVRLFGNIMDISERKNAEAEIHRLNAELEERVVQRTAQLAAANQELERFAYSVSHDLRVPLRAIDGFSQILRRRYDATLDDEGKRLLGVVRDNTKRMAQLIDDILAFSRMGRLEIKPATIDMGGLVRAICEELQPSLGDRALDLEIAALPTAQGDPSLLRQVWINLLANAIKFTRPQPAPRIEVGGRCEAGERIYWVKDNGVGFDMKYVDKLFGVFQRLHGVEEFEGTGIGLAIVKRIVGRHGGRVWAEGAINAGATISFTLPVLEEEQHE